MLPFSTAKAGSQRDRKGEGSKKELGLSAEHLYAMRGRIRPKNIGRRIIIRHSESMTDEEEKSKAGL